MIMNNMKISKLWNSLAKEKFSLIDDVFLSTFREPGNANNRLAAWDPYDKSMRYYKFLLFHQIQNKNEAFFQNYSKIGLTTLGNPVSIAGPMGDEINLDHFFAIEEYTFLNKNLEVDELNYVVEIGAGFGRTAQALLKLIRNIKTYTIIDIPEVLSLSSRYLKKILTKEEFDKLRFKDAQKLSQERCDSCQIDLVINIDSFQEMPPETITYYFDKIICRSSFFYTKNAVGKYNPESIGLDNLNQKQLLDVFSLGLSTDIIDIFNNSDLIKAREKHVKQYCPSDLFNVVAQEPLGIFPYYHNVLYQREFGE